MEQMQTIGTFIISFGGGMIIGFFVKSLFDTCVEERVSEELRKRGLRNERDKVSRNEGQR